MFSKFRNTRKNRKWVGELYYPADAGNNDWYVNTSAGHETEDVKKQTNSVFVSICKAGSNMPHYNVGYVHLDRPVDEFRAEFLKLTREAIAKVDVMNSLGVGDNGITNQCANCQNDAAVDDFLCQKCRDNA